MSSKEPVIASSTNKAHSIKPNTNKRSKLAIGGPSDILISESDLIEQASSSN